MEPEDGGFTGSKSSVELATDTDELEAKREAIRARIQAAKAKQQQEEGVQRIDERYATIRIEPKPDEEGDKNFPPHLHAAAQLFCMTNNVHLAKQLKMDVDAYFETLKEGPDGTSSHTIGRGCVVPARLPSFAFAALPPFQSSAASPAATPSSLRCVCWLCGHVGVPKNADKCEKGQKVPGVCGHCGENAQTNFVRLDQPRAPGEAPRSIPWMQARHPRPGECPRCRAPRRARGRSRRARR